MPTATPTLRECCRSTAQLPRDLNRIALPHGLSFCGHQCHRLRLFWLGASGRYRPAGKPKCPISLFRLSARSIERLPDGTPGSHLPSSRRTECDWPLDGCHPGHFGRPGVIEPIGERTQWRNILFLAHSPPLLIKTRHVVQVVRVSCCDLLAGAQCASQPDQLGGCKLSSS